MVGIVLVSHSYRIADGAAELAREMGGPDVRLETAGGLDTPEHAIGTDAVLVMAAIERAWSDRRRARPDGSGQRGPVGRDGAGPAPRGTPSRASMLCEAPFVEGAVAAAVTAKMGASLDDGRPRSSRRPRGQGGAPGHRGVDGTRVPTASSDGGVPDEAASTATITVGQPARPPCPAGRQVRADGVRRSTRGSTFANLTNGRGPANAASLNAVAILGATEGHRLEISASGPQAAEVIAALRSLAERNFDEHPLVRSAASMPTADAEPADDVDAARTAPARPPRVAGDRDRADRPLPRASDRRARRASR